MLKVCRTPGPAACLKLLHILDKTGKTKIGQKFGSEVLFGDFKTGVAMVAFQLSGKLQDKILALPLLAFLSALCV